MARDRALGVAWPRAAAVLLSRDGISRAHLGPGDRTLPGPPLPGVRCARAMGAAASPRRLIPGGRLAPMSRRSAKPWAWWARWASGIPWAATRSRWAPRSGPQSFSALVLLDPVIRAKDEYVGPWKKTDFVRKRRNQWASAQEMFERFENRPPFDSWDRQALRDYCDNALKANGEGYILACPPDDRSVHLRGQHSGGIEHLSRDRDRSDSRAGGPRRALYGPGRSDGIVHHGARSGGQLRARNGYLPAEYSHFMPMEAPELAAKLIHDTLSLL